MTEKVDVLFINPGNRKQIYQDLGDEHCPIEILVFARLITTYIRQKESSIDPINNPALNFFTIKNKKSSPPSWLQFFQHTYNTLSFSNKHCSVAKITALRDYLQNRYFTSKNSLSMVRNKFGKAIFDNIGQMIDAPLNLKNC